MSPAERFWLDKLGNRIIWSHLKWAVCITVWRVCQSGRYQNQKMDGPEGSNLASTSAEIHDKDRCSRLQDFDRNRSRTGLNGLFNTVIKILYCGHSCEYTDTYSPFVMSLYHITYPK